MNTTIDEYAQRPKRSLESDGIFDMMTGLLVMVMTFVFQIQSSHTRYEWPASLGLLFVAMIFLPRGATFLKQRFSQPRLGYILPRHAPSMMVILGTGLGSLILVWFLAWVYSQPQLLRLLHLRGKMTMVDIGVLVGVALFVQFIRLRFYRHLIVAAITILCAILLAVSPMRFQPAYFLLSLIFSLSMIVSGAVPFIKLLHTPVARDREIE